MPRSFWLALRLVFVGLPLLDMAGIAESRQVRARVMAQSSGMPVCPVTRPNGVRYTAEPPGGNYGNDALVTGLWSEGRVVFKPGGAGFVVSDDALSMKFWWWRLRPGRLRLEGQRLDGPAPPMHASIPEGYGEIGFQATALIFPTPSCWEVTGRIGDASLTFVTLVEKIGEGPTHLDSR